MRGLAGRLAGCLLASIGVLSFPPSLARADTLSIARVKLGDVSGYRGAWRIDRQITRLLSEALLSLNGVSLAPASDVWEAARQTIGMPDESLDTKKLLMIGRAVGADLAVGGTVDKLSLEGQGVVSYRAGGYERFVGEVDLTLTVIETRGGSALVNKEKISISLADDDVGIAILQGPGNRPTEETLYKIWNAPVESDLVQGSIIGRAMAQAAMEASSRVARAISGVPAGREGRVVRVRGRDIYISLGSEDDVREGDVVMIWENVEAVRDPKTSVMLGFTRASEGAEAEVREIRGRKLSICRTAEDQEFREGDTVRFLGGRRAGKWAGARRRPVQETE